MRIVLEVELAAAVAVVAAAERAASSAKVGLSQVNTIGSFDAGSAIDCLPASPRSVGNEPGATNDPMGK